MKTMVNRVAAIVAIFISPNGQVSQMPKAQNNKVPSLNS